MLVKFYLRLFFLFVIATASLMITELNVNAQVPDEVILSALQANAKLNNAGEIFADFNEGKTETGVIVLLKSSGAANVLAAKSQLSAQVPEMFRKPGAPTYYNLQDQSVKKQLKATVTETVEKTINELGSAGMRVTQKFTFQFGFAAKVTPSALEKIVNHPDVIGVSKDGILHADLAQGIPLMNATTARSTYPGSGVSIAICDTGIDTSHPRLGNGGSPFNVKVIGGYDTGDGDADPRPTSAVEAAHGTACAGIAAGDTGTAEGDYIGGVANGAKLYAIKISKDSNPGFADFSALLAGWEWAIANQNLDPSNPIMIISTSFSAGSFSNQDNCDWNNPPTNTVPDPMATAAANAIAAGITIFASSGNNGYCGSMGYPACISSVNSVGAVHDASWGTWGFCVDATSCAPKVADVVCASGFVASDATSADKVTSYSNSASFLTLFAPSHNAYTTDIVGAGGYSSGDYDTSFGGTSAATPYAAGAAAVLQNAAKTLTGNFLSPSQVQQLLVNYGVGVTDTKVAVTKPRINLGNAVNALVIATAPTVTTQAVSTINTTTATGNGNITSLGSPNPIQHGVCWNIGGTPTTLDNCTQEGAAGSTGAFTSSITGLAPGTKYYVRAYAINIAYTSYGEQVSFTTIFPWTMFLPAITVPKTD